MNHCCISYQVHLTAPVSYSVQDHTGEHREALEDFEETRGGEESRHGFGLFLFLTLSSHHNIQRKSSWSSAIQELTEIRRANSDSE